MSTIKLPIITPRLLLRDYVNDDVHAVYSYTRDPEVVRYMN